MLVLDTFNYHLTLDIRFVICAANTDHVAIHGGMSTTTCSSE
jgi:hypothetical protein